MTFVLNHLNEKPFKLNNDTIVKTVPDECSVREDRSRRSMDADIYTSGTLVLGSGVGTSSPV